MSPNGTGPFIGECKENVCSGTWSGVIPGNNGELIGKWKGDGVGPDDGKELYIGYEGIPDVDDIVLSRRNRARIYKKNYDKYRARSSLRIPKRSKLITILLWELAHTFAKEFVCE